MDPQSTDIQTEIIEKEKILFFLLKKEDTCNIDNPTKIDNLPNVTDTPISINTNVPNISNSNSIATVETATKIAENSNSFNQVCRTCLSQKGELNSLFKNHYNDMLMYITTLQFVLNDGMPPKICSKCISNLNKAFSFKRQIEHADSYLRQYISKHPHDVLPTNMLELNYEENDQTRSNNVIFPSKCSLPKNISINDKNTQSTPLLFHNDANVPSTPAQPLFLLLRPNTSENPSVPNTIIENVTNTIIKTESKLEETTAITSTSVASSENISNTNKNVQKVEEQSSIEDVHVFGEHFLLKDAGKKKVNLKSDEIKRNKKPSRKYRKKEKQIKYNDSSDSDDAQNELKNKKKCISSDENDYCDNISNDDEFKPKRKYKSKTGENCKTVKKNHKCHICNKVFPIKGGLRTHMRTHGIGEKKHLCTYCNKSFYSPFELVIHIRTHTGEKPNVCETCGKSFADPRSLMKHNKIHTGEKKYECDICKKRFIHAFTLRTHKRVHTGEKPFICSTCGHGCNTSTQLTLHMRIHTQEKPYSCKHCPKKFASSSGLATHQLTHTGQRRYMCSYCGKGARTSTDLQTHIRTHTGEKPYACKLVPCTKRYKTQSQLSAHMRTHTGEKNHKCRYCEKAFADSTQLKSHENIHTGVKPYACSICGNRFTQSGSLYTHMKSHDTTTLQT